MSTENKDFKVKHGLSVANGGSFGGTVVIGEPVDPNHATTKNYVDTVIASGVGTGGTPPVRVATTANINISTDTEAGDFIDGIQLVAGNRILIKNQTDQTQNGIYTVNASGPATRASDYNTALEMTPGKSIYVLTGDTNTGTLWHLQNYVTDLGIDPINFIFAGPVKTGTGLTKSSIYEIEINDAVVATLESNQNGVALASDITISSLTEVGQLSSLSVLGDITSLENISGDSANITNNLSAGSLTVTGNFSVTNGGDTELEALTVDGEATFNNLVNFTSDVNVLEPTESAHPATKNYVDSLVNQEVRTIDDLSNYFNGYNSRFLPTYQGVPVTLENPFNLLLTIDGIIQSVGSPDYVWQSVMPRVGFRIDNDGYIAFPEAVPVGSTFDARILVGSATTTQTKVYPFKAMDIVLGGY